MANGGTIPTERKPVKVTFYNTTGVIEKEKNIYYVPRTSKVENITSNVVRDIYLKAFESVCPPSSAYKDMDLSTWSPQDRTVVVRGNIDDFRLVTDEGECFNYFIITRKVTKNNVEYTYYYAFFITNVEQAGGSSIRITAQPDDFTNVFYLHNTTTLTAGQISSDYEPFNEKMKNCYVNRQHYNRVKKVVSHYDKTASNLSINTMIVLATVNVEFLGVSADDAPINMTIENYTVVSGTGVVRDLSYNAQTGYIVLNMYSSQLNVPFVIDLEYSYEIDEGEVEVDNLKVFLNQEESFRFKYQYRDLKYPLCPYTNPANFTVEEMEEIENYQFNDLSEDLQKKIILSSLRYLVIETKSLEVLGKVGTDLAGGAIDPSWQDVTRGNYIEGFTKANMVMYVPFISLPKVFKDKGIVIPNFNCCISINNVDFVLKSEEDTYKMIIDNNMGDHLLNIYISNDVAIPSTKISVDLENNKVKFLLTNIIDLDNVNNKEGRLYAYYMHEKPADFGHNKGIIYTYSSDPFSVNKITQITSGFGGTIGLVTYDYSRKITLDINENIPDLKQKYYDLVIESEPYNFYSLSYLSYEMPFNKNRYFVGKESNINVDYFISFNGAVKEIYAPVYTVEEKETIYFNEGLTFTLSSSLPLLSSSYLNYYYQNMSQMKNQYAVNNFNRGIDLLQHFLISGPNAVGYTASKRGGWGALAETGNQLMQMADEGIDWAQSDKVIEMNQSAVLADMGRRPDVLKQTGSDVYLDLTTGENIAFINHYSIDKLSYNSIAKLLERIGYQVNLYDTLNVVDRVGWNFIKLNGFDWNVNVNIMTSQEQSIRGIFSNGVTLLHDKTYLTSGHNFETILEE